MARNLTFIIGTLVLSICLSSCGPTATFPQGSPQADRDLSLARGRYLVESVAACGFCHGEKGLPGDTLSGGLLFKDKYGIVAAANITPSAQGIGNWSESEIVRTLRSGIRPDETHLSLEVHTGYEWLSESDIFSIASYLKSLPPNDNVVQRREIDFVDRNMTGFFDKWGTVEGFVPELRPTEKIGRGRYLVDQVSQCSACHSFNGGIFGSDRYLEGGEVIEREVATPQGSTNANEQSERILESRVAPNITPDREFGIGSWSEDDIVRFLRTSQSPGNRGVDPNFCPVGFYSRASDQDLFAIAAYLRSL